MSTRNEIVIESDQKPNYYFLVNFADHFNIKYLRKIYPLAAGLSYIKNGQVVNIIPADNGNLILDENVNKYKLLYSLPPTAEEKKLQLQSLILQYFQLQYNYKEICELLRIEHNIIMSERTLRRIINQLNLRRKNVVESSVEDIVWAMVEEVYGSGFNLGYVSLWRRLRKEYGLTVKQATVLKYLRIIDPEGIESRSRYRLNRRRYSVPGPNYLWHIDGMDKLKKFGFAISACVDGFSKKVIFLQVSTTNNKPEVIAHYYLEALREHNCVPELMRSDCGTENTIIDVMQMALRTGHNDENAGKNSFIKGKSTANERVEKYWRELRSYVGEWYMRFFKRMVQKRQLDHSDELQKELLRFCFGKVLQEDLERAKDDWNEHRIRKQSRRQIPSGIPNIMYKCPEKFNGVECKKEVSLAVVEQFEQDYTIKPKLYNPIIKDIIQILMPNVSEPTSFEEAYHLFLALKERAEIININRT